MRPSDLRKTESLEADLTIGPDIEIIPSAEELSAVTLEPDLSLHIEPIQATEPIEPAATSKRRRIIDYFGPEVTAGIGISILFAIFAGLMLLGVSEQSDDPVDSGVTTPAPVAPAGEVPVEIGEGVTLERE